MIIWHFGSRASLELNGDRLHVEGHLLSIKKQLCGRQWSMNNIINCCNSGNNYITIVGKL